MTNIPMMVFLFDMRLSYCSLLAIAAGSWG